MYGVEYKLDNVVLKAGTLKIDVNARGHGTFELDGQPIRGAQNIVVEFEVGKNPTLYIESVLLDGPVSPTASATDTSPADPVQSIKDEELQREMDRASSKFLPCVGLSDVPLSTVPLKPLFFGGGMMRFVDLPGCPPTPLVDGVKLHDTQIFVPRPPDIMATSLGGNIGAVEDLVQKDDP